ncbi:MAG: restriction endonuclease [Leptospiraceae bacterium]|nr:restriction endonuclease [Leptospiraceae bacterium]
MSDFKKSLEKYFKDFEKLISTESGEWTVKGFIDIYKNIYTISVDTKVVSKVLELMIFPVIVKFSNENNYDMILSSHQNHYPDITFIDKKTKKKIALDLKTTYKITSTKVNGMTLGAFTGYFRNRDSNKNITFPYSEYDKHFILGIIYSKTDIVTAEQEINKLGYKVETTQRKNLEKYISDNSLENLDILVHSLNIINNDIKNNLKKAIDTCLIDEKNKYSISDLQSIISVVRDFEFFVQEKWKIAIDRPGSGNTKNIGSTTDIKELKEGTAIFTKIKNGEKIFSDFWMYYMTQDMAKSVDLDKPPYHNLESYFEYKGMSKE